MLQTFCEVVGHLSTNSFFAETETDLNRARDFAAAQVQSHKWQDPNSLKMVVQSHRIHTYYETACCTLF
jgi:hypothetical protein